MEFHDFDTSKIEAMSREALEAKLVQALKHLMHGVEIVKGANEAIHWLAGTVVLMGGILDEAQPETKAEVARLVQKAKKIASLD